MINYLGDFVEDDVVYIMFNTFTSDDPSASSTITNFINTDVHIHKDDGLTQRNNAAGITVSVNFDGITGSHLIKIDTNDNTVGGFWVTGHDYFVRIEGTTVDAATINAVVGHFSIQNRFMRGTDSAALAATALTDATWTDAKAGHLDAPISTVDTVADGIQTDLSNVTDGLGALKALLDTISGYTDKIDDATNGLTAIKAEVEGLAGAAMRGTDGANTTVPDAAGVAPTAAEIKTEVEQAGSSIAQILADTNELELDWKNTGRLDNLLDACNTVTPDAAGVVPTAVEIRQEMDTNSTKMAPSQTLNDYKATGFNTVVPDIAGTAATPTEVATALSNIHLDHLLAADYDPASKPGVATALLNELIENDGGVSRYTANALEQAPSAGTNPNVLIDTTIASVTDQTHFVLTAGSNDDDAYKDQAIVIYDADDSDFPSIRVCSAYTGATKTVTLDSTPDFTIVAGDGCKVFVTAPGTTAPTVGQIRAEMEGAGYKLAIIEADTNELQTNQGAWATATGFSTHDAAAVKTAIEAGGSSLATILADTNELQTDWVNGGRLDLLLDACNTTVPDAAGVAPTAVEIKAEVVAALADIKLDHLLNIAVDTDWATTVHLDSVIGHMADVGTAATFNRTTDALEALRNRGDAAWIAATGFSTHSAADVKTAIEQAGSSIATILTDTGELQTDWVNGGRLDNLLDACNTTTPPTVTAIREEMDTNSVDFNSILEDLVDIKGTNFAKDTHSLKNILDDVTGLNGSAMIGTNGANTTTPPTVVAIRTEMEGAGSKILAIEGDTNELQTDWKNTGRLDNLLDACNTVTPDAAGVAPTSAEIKTAIEAGGSSLAQILADTGELQTDWVNGGRLDLLIDLILGDTAELQGNQGDWATATSVTVSDKTGFALSGAGVDAILDENIEGTHSMREMMRLFASMLVGKVSGGGTTAITFRDIDDSKNRIVMTVTDVGNRTDVVLTED